MYAITCSRCMLIILRSASPSRILFTVSSTVNHSLFDCHKHFLSFRNFRIKMGSYTEEDMSLSRMAYIKRNGLNPAFQKVLSDAESRPESVRSFSDTSKSRYHGYSRWIARRATTLTARKYPRSCLKVNPFFQNEENKTKSSSRKSR